MPFGKTTDEHTEEYWTKHFENFLKPLIEENPNLEARRSKPLRGDILNEIIADLVTSPIVVANLTDKNANVCWELGVRQSFKHGTITIAEEVTDLPFNIGGKGTLQYYPKDYIQNETFRKDFKEAIEDCLLNPNKPDSQVLETLSGRGTLFEIFYRDEAIRRLDAVLLECGKNLELLERIVNQVRANKQKPENLGFIASRYRTIAIELLITSRYVDEDQTFFELADDCWNKLYSLNDTMNDWRNYRETTEKFIEKEEAGVEKLIGNFKAEIEAIRDKLINRF